MLSSPGHVQLSFPGRWRIHMQSIASDENAAGAALHFAKLDAIKRPHNVRYTELVQTDPLTTVGAYKLHE